MTQLCTTGRVTCNMAAVGTAVSAQPLRPLRRGFRVSGETMTTVLAPDGVESLVTVEEAATLCNVASATVRQWASRGYGPARRKTKLEPKGQDDRGRKLYRLLDVAKAEHATRTLARR